ncbi:putative type IX sorting system protein PorV2 [Ferruginibacter sp.]
MIILPAIGFAQFRKYSNEFLNIGAGARGLAMGNAQVASVSDATAGYWNPAGLVGVKDHPNLNLMHAEYFAGIAKYDYAALAIPINDNKRTIGVSVLRFAVDDIPNTLYLVEPDGSINYNNIKTFSSADWAFLLSFAQNVKVTENKRISFGANAKVIYRKVGSFATAWGFGLDAGIQMHGKRGHFGIVARDLTTTFNAWSFKFTEKEKEVLYLTNNEIPVKSTELTAPRVVIGGGYNFRLGKSVNLMAEANLDITFDGKRNTVFSSDPVSVDPHLGLEASIKEVFFVRGGITNFQKALADGDTTNQKKVWIYQPSVGAGFKIKNVMLDYAFTNLANQSNPLYTHIFSLRINLIKKEND